MSISIPPANTRAPGVPGGSYVIETEDVYVTEGPPKPAQDPFWLDGVEPGDHGTPSIFGPGIGGGGAPPPEPPPEQPTATPVATPQAPASKDPPIQTGLGDKVDDVLNRSPTLRKQWKEAQDKGWQIKVGEYGGGSRADPSTRPPTIFVDKQDLAKGSHDLASLLAHEIGHAARGFPPGPVPANTLEDYVSKNVRQRLEHEGVAAFENARARHEILNSGGEPWQHPDIGIRGRRDEEYIAIYEKFYRGDLTEEQAIALMAEVMGREAAGLNSDGSYYSKEEQAIREATDEWIAQHLNTGPASAL
jgi:hypothetical protein